MRVFYLTTSSQNMSRSFRTFPTESLSSQTVKVRIVHLIIAVWNDFLEQYYFRFIVLSCFSDTENLVKK